MQCNYLRYQITVGDQNASIKVLNQALTVLQNVYGESLLQQPAAYEDKGQHGSSNKVHIYPRILVVLCHDPIIQDSPI